MKKNIYNDLLKNKKEIFFKNINNKSKLIALNIKENFVGNNKYFPADSKEWKNKIYHYNYNFIKNSFIFKNQYINKLIKSYFSLRLKKNVLKEKYISRRKKRLTLKRVFISKPEIQYNNSKLLTITIYIFNTEILFFFKKLKLVFRYLKKLNRISKLIRKPKKFNAALKKRKFKLFLKRNKRNSIFIIYNFFQKLKKLFYYINIPINNKYTYNYILKKFTKYLLHRELFLIRKYKFNLNIFNHLKFSQTFLTTLSSIIKELYMYKNINIEFNIVNLRSIIMNTDIFTEYLKFKLKRRRVRVLRALNFITAKMKLPRLNWVKEKTRIVNNINRDKLENIYPNLNINSIINKKYNLSKLLKKLYTKTFYYKKFSINKYLYTFFIKKKNIIIDSIKYKHLRGVKLEANGRLTRRYRAEKAIHKLKLKGGLKNIDSSFKGLSNINFRGYMNSNIEYSTKISKRRVGAFAIKGWISGI